MKPEIRKELEIALSKCDGTKYPSICNKLGFSEGKELIMNMIYNRLSKFPTWDLGNALADVEVNLSGFNNE